MTKKKKAISVKDEIFKMRKSQQEIEDDELLGSNSLNQWNDSQINDNEDFEEFQIKGIEPKDEIVFTREDNDNINSKWKQRQKDLYNRTQKFLKKLEQREIDYQRENYPTHLFEKIEQGFMRIEPQVQGEEVLGTESIKAETREGIYQDVQKEMRNYYKSNDQDNEVDDSDSMEILDSDDETYIRLDTNIKTDRKNNPDDENSHTTSLVSSVETFSSSGNVN